jgi:uncharacterized protein YjbI with pentapeptide repeats
VARYVCEVSPNVPTQPLWWRHERHGLSEWWLARGELKHSRFELPGGVPPRPNVLLLGARFEDVDFSGLELNGFIVAESVIEGCKFSRASFASVSFGALQYHKDWNTPIDWSKPLDVRAPRYSQTLYIGCQFRAVRLPRRNTHFGNSRFDKCLFEDTLRSTVKAPIFTEPAEFISCRFDRRVSCVVFDGRVLGAEHAIRVGRTECAFTGNDFSRAELKSVDFRNIDLATQRLPQGFSASR